MWSHYSRAEGLNTEGQWRRDSQSLPVKPDRSSLILQSLKLIFLQAGITSDTPDTCWSCVCVCVCVCVGGCVYEQAQCIHHIKGTQICSYTLIVETCLPSKVPTRITSLLLYSTFFILSTNLMIKLKPAVNVSTKYCVCITADISSSSEPQSSTVVQKLLKTHQCTSLVLSFYVYLLTWEKYRTISNFHHNAREQ